MNKKILIVVFTFFLIIVIGSALFYLRKQPNSKITFYNNFNKSVKNKALLVLSKKTLPERYSGEFSIGLVNEDNLFLVTDWQIKKVDIKGNIKSLYSLNRQGELGGITLDNIGNIYIAEADLAYKSEEPTPRNPKITVINQQGKFIRSFGLPDDVYILPKISSKNHLFISDFHTHIPNKRTNEQQTVYMFNLKGKLLRKIKGIGNIKSYAMDSKENLYFGEQVDPGPQYKGLQVSKFSTSGKLLKQALIKKENGRNGYKEVLGFNNGVDDNGFIYVSFDRWQKPGFVAQFDITGHLIRRFTKPHYDFDWIFTSPNGDVYIIQNAGPKNDPSRVLKLYRMSL